MKHEFTAILPGFHPDQDGVPQLWAVTEWRDGATVAAGEKRKAWPAGTVFAYCHFTGNAGAGPRYCISRVNPSEHDWSAINGPDYATSHEEAVKKAYALAHLRATTLAKFVTLFRKKEDGSESFASIPVEHAWFSEQGRADGVCFERCGGGIVAQYYWENYPASPYAGGKEQKTLWEGVKWLRDCWAAGKAKKDVEAAPAEKPTAATAPLSKDTPGYIFWPCGQEWWKALGKGTTTRKEEACIYTYEDFLKENDPKLEFHPLAKKQKCEKSVPREENSYSFSGDADFHRILQENPGKDFIICRVQHEKYRQERQDKNGPAEAWLVIERRKDGCGGEYPVYNYFDSKEEALAGARKEKWTVFPG